MELKSRDLGCYSLTCDAENATRKCSRCTLARYCNSDCQRNHWREHKPLCILLQPLRAALREFKRGQVAVLEEQYDSLSDGQVNELVKDAGISFINMRKHLPEHLEEMFKTNTIPNNPHQRYMYATNRQYVPRTRAEFMDHHQGVRGYADDREQGNLFYMDIPWRSDDPQYHSDIPAICDYLANVQTPDGSALNPNINAGLDDLVDRVDDRDNQ